MSENSQTIPDINSELIKNDYLLILLKQCNIYNSKFNENGIEHNNHSRIFNLISLYKNNGIYNKSGDLIKIDNIMINDDIFKNFLISSLIILFDIFESNNENIASDFYNKINKNLSPIDFFNNRLNCIKNIKEKKDGAGNNKYNYETVINDNDKLNELVNEIINCYNPNQMSQNMLYSPIPQSYSSYFTLPGGIYGGKKSKRRVLKSNKKKRNCKTLKSKSKRKRIYKIKTKSKKRYKTRYNK